MEEGREGWNGLVLEAMLTLVAKQQEDAVLLPLPRLWEAQGWKRATEAPGLPETAKTGAVPTEQGYQRLIRHY